MASRSPSRRLPPPPLRAEILAQSSSRRKPGSTLQHLAGGRMDPGFRRAFAGMTMKNRCSHESYAHKRVYDQVVEGVAAEARKIKVGPGMDPGTDMGLLVSGEQFNRVTGYINSGIEEGANVAAGGKKAGTNGGYFVQPTVLTDTKPTMKVVREEIF